MIPSILTRPLDFPRPSCSKIDIEENIAERSLVDARPPRDEAAKATPRSGADHIVPDCARQNFCAIDRRLRDLLPHHLAPEDFSHLDRLGRLAGRRLDELVCVADKHPPVLNPRDHFGRDEGWIDYHCSWREWGSIAFGDFQFGANTGCSI
jgi:acyl-CoA dehydrogenase